jgi:hypothetical protein
MKEGAMVEFVDLDSRSRGFSLVRYELGIVALTLSLETNGDIEVFLPVDAARALQLALGAAIDGASGGGS